jgi:hypothetical protein
MKMKYSLVLVGIIILFPAFLFSQNTTTGTVFNSKTKKPIPFAQIKLLSNQQVSLTNQYGSFQIEQPKQFDQIEVSYLGFESKTIPVESGKQYLIQIKKGKGTGNNSRNLSATGILAKTRKNQKNLRKAYKNYSYLKYSKLFIDKTSKITDFIRDGEDSSKGKAHDYLSEQVFQFNFSQEKGVKQRVLGTKTAGFKKPVYQVLRKKMHSDSWYENAYTIFGKEYASPLSKNAKRNYTFELIGKTNGERPAFLIHFIPKRPKAVASLEGVLFIDSSNFGLQRVKAQLDRSIKIEIDQDFEYDKKADSWLPKKVLLLLKPGNGGERVKIYGGNLSLGSLARSQDEQDFKDPKAMKITTAFKDFKFNRNKTDLPQNEIQVLEKASERSGQFWKKNRSFPFTKSDGLTSEHVDSVVKAGNFERKIDIRENFEGGYFPLGFFDVNLRYLIKLNNYEGIRPGFGGRTNDKFSETFRIETYLKYGFKDKKFKYSFGGGFRLDKEQPTWLTAHYTKDIYEVGKYTFLTDLLVYTLFEPRLVNIDFYYKYKSFDIDLQRQFFPGLQTEFKLKRSEIRQTNTKPYSYRLGDQNYSNYNLSEAKLAIRWDPNSHFLKSTEKTIKLKDKYPVFTLQMTQAVDNVFDSDFNFTKVGGKIEYTINRLSQNNTEFSLEGDLGLGELPLTHAFHAYPNNPVKPTIVKRFSVAGRHSFETMYFSEFFSSKLASLHIKHYLRRFEISKRIRPQLVFITRHAIGDMDNIDRHQGFDFNTLEKGYSESGFEINKIFWGFGLSFAYRYGAYHLPELEDNISFKFTYYMSI